MLIFNFHHVEKRVSAPYRKLITITPGGLRRFIRTMRFLGWKIVSLGDVLEGQDFAKDTRGKIALTFDDGFVNNYLYAAPVLEEEKCPATIFVLPGRFGGDNEWDQRDIPGEGRDQLMTIGQMQALGRSQYITFGSHGMRHRDLRKLSEKELRYEIHESFHLLKENLGSSFLPILAYPWGYCSERVIKIMKQSAYQYAFTVEPKPWESAQNPYQAPRFSVYLRDGNSIALILKLLRHGIMPFQRNWFFQKNMDTLLPEKP